MIAVVAIAAAGLQLFRAEDMRLDVLALAHPLLWIALPVMAVTASIAVFFEVTPGLRGGFGNVVFFVLWSAMLQSAGSLTEPPYPAPGSDFVGFSAALPSFYEAQESAYPTEPANRKNFSAGINFTKDGSWRPRTFAWPGVDWNPAILSRRFAWLVGALLLLGVSALIFDRFQHHEEPRRRRRRRRARAAAEVAEGPSSTALDPLAKPTPHLSVLPAGAQRSMFAPLAAQEFVLLLKGTSRWWWIPILGLNVAALLTPMAIVLEWLLPMMWIWPLLHWSSLGGREQRHATVELMMSAPRPILRPVMASWIAGSALALLVAAAVILRVVLAGAWGHFGGILAGASFVPAVAIALGTWTGSGKLFEVLYMLLWYIVMNRVPALDYTGGSSAAVAKGLPLVWVGLAAASLALALGGRARLARR
jgi:hypothetical protein